MRLRNLAVAGLLVLAASPAWAGDPTAELRRSIDGVLRILKNPGLQRKPAERRAALRRAIQPAFDFPEVARRVLGRHWHERTAEEGARFVALFGELLDATYLSRIEAYAGEQIVYVGESIDGDHATVRSRIITRKGAEVPVDYRMLRRGDHWVVYDVIIENVSLVENYRSQFNSIIETSSYPQLVERIRAKVRELNTNPEPAGQGGGPVSGGEETSRPGAAGWERSSGTDGSTA